jgi:2-polyprenyl-6-hydroxyphenyl methylase/3-demethylubiquinone-9 3-methyltransferase
VGARRPAGRPTPAQRGSRALLRTELGGFAGKRILDIGSGGGIFTGPLAAAGASVVGIDPSERSIEAAREHAAAHGLQIDYRVAYAETFDCKEEFDSVLAVDVLEHVDDLDQTIATCARLLKSGGVFGFLTHNQTLEAFELYIWKGEYELGFIPRETTTCTSSSGPTIYPNGWPPTGSERPTSPG